MNVPVVFHEFFLSRLEPSVIHQAFFLFPVRTSGESLPRKLDAAIYTAFEDKQPAVKYDGVRALNS